MTPEPLPVGTPSAQGVDARGVHALLDALEGEPAVEPHSLVVLRHGRVVAQGWWAPYAGAAPHLLYSLSKSFTSLAAGIAAAEGLLDLDDTVLSHFPELDDEVTDPRSRSLLVRHAAAMASGHVKDAWERAVALDPDDPVRGFLLLPPEQEPGSVFAYNQCCTYALAAIVQRAAGTTLTEYLRPRLLDPLGIGEVGWQQHPAGRDLGFTGLHAPTDAVARLGQLLLQGGEWQGRQLVPRAWVQEATRRQIATTGDVPDWSQGYGYQFWQSQHGYRGDGAYGQFCLVLPEHDAVVAVTAATTAMQEVLDAVWSHLLPALGEDPLAGGSEADAALSDRLAGLALAPVAERPEPAGDPAGWAGPTFAPAGGTCAAQPSLTGVSVQVAADGWQVVLDEEGTLLPCRLGTGAWALAEPPAPGGAVPIAVSGGWTGSGALRFSVVFRETPHRLEVECAPATGTFEARWATVPLRAGRLVDLRSPRVPAPPR